MSKHLWNALVSAVAGSVATLVGVALYVAAEEPKAILVGAGFGASLAPYGALLALPVGLLLGLVRPRIKRAQFAVTATTVAMALGGVLGWWIAAGSYILFQPISVFLAFTWAIAACTLCVSSGRPPVTSLERTRGE